MRKLFLTILLLSLAACGGQPVERPRLARTGAPAPELSLKKILNAPGVKEIGGWKDLEGKAVVLEFWATWCDPCVESIPHMNQLADRFSGKPVVFLSVTDESEADVNAFLREHRMNSWVAPEAGAGVFKAFRVYGRPHTVLIGRDGAVSAFSSPAEVTEETVLKLLSSAPAAAPARAADAAPQPQAEPLAEFYLGRSTSTSGSADYGEGRMYARGMPLKYALTYLYGGVDRLDVKPGAEEAMAGSYDIRLNVPPARAAQKREFFLRGLETALGLGVKESFREADVLVLKLAPGGPINVKESREFADPRRRGTVIEAPGSGFTVLAQLLAESLREPVLDETRDKKIYKFTFDRGDDNPRAVSVQLQKQLGLRLDRLRRKVHVLEISPVKAAR